MQAEDVAMKSNRPFGLVIHGGAGTIRRQDMPPELEARYRERLQAALDAGYAVLDKGGASMDAVLAAITVMEDSPLFNAGKGAVLNADGICEMDAAVMDGRTLAAGAVASLHHIKSPIHLARDVMTRSPHVMMIGDGAEKFAQSLNYEMMPADYFQTEMRRKQLDKARQDDANDAKAAQERQEKVTTTADDFFRQERKFGTVGCVALDQAGNLAAGTSTGGMTNKKFGRVGDAPIIGAGTYANNATCALSATGHGEYFIRAVVGHDVSALMEYKQLPVADAARTVIEKVGRLGGTGGVIAIDRAGNIALPFNTEGMYRGHHVSTGAAVIEIYK